MSFKLPPISASGNGHGGVHFIGAVLDLTCEPPTASPVWPLKLPPPLNHHTIITIMMHCYVCFIMFILTRLSCGTMRCELFLL